MAKKITNLLIFLPLGIILIIFCVANRQSRDARLQSVPAR